MMSVGCYVSLMAPFRGGKGRAQNNYEDSARSGDRKSHYAQSRRGGRTRGGLKRNFTSSRVDDQTQDDPEQRFDEASRLDEQSTSDSDGILSDDDDEEAAVMAVKPYVQRSPTIIKRNISTGTAITEKTQEE